MLLTKTEKPNKKRVINIDDIMVFCRILKKLKFKLWRLSISGITLAVLEVAALLLLASFVNTALQQPKTGIENAGILNYLHLSSLTFNEQSTICIFVFLLRFLAGLALQNFILLQSTQLQTSLRLLLFSNTLDSRRQVKNEQQKASGAMSDVIVRQVTHVGKGILEPFLRVIGELVILFGILLVVLLVSPGFLLLMVVVITPIVLLYLLKFKSLSRRFGDKSNHSLEELSELSVAFCNGWRQLSVFSLHENAVSMLLKSSNNFARNDRLANLLSGAPRYFLELFLAFFIIIIVAWVNRSEEMGFSELVFVAGAGLRILPIVTSISNALISFQYNRAVLHNVVTLLEPSIAHELAPKHKVKENIQDDCLDKIESRISLQNVGFQYSPHNPLFGGVNEEFCAGDFVLITGKSGVGKTTLMDLICGIRKPTEGNVIINGVIGDPPVICPLNIFYAPQDPLIIPGTILENVTMLKTENISGSEEVLATSSLEQVGLIDEGISLKNLLNSTVGPDGDKLSGGQKQRLVLARALYHGADVLALDEIISGLEMDSKRKVLKLLQELAASSKLVMLISHDPVAKEFASKCVSL